jgi:hydroxymethylglutaryl-CoA reductase
VSDSRISGLYRLSVAERIHALEERGVISTQDARSLLQGSGILGVAAADNMIENVIGVFGLPLAIAPNFLVNDKDYIVPMVVEEPSIVAGVSGAAKLFRDYGGFHATSTDPILIGQIQVVDVENPDVAIRALVKEQKTLIDQANRTQPKLIARGGGVREIEYFKYRLADGRWTIVLHLLVDTRDAMGANMVNSICEGLAPTVEQVCGGRVCLRILSNLADRALVTASGRVSLAALADAEFGAEEVRDGIVLANEIANADPYRAATHNKGIMNGVDAVALATGNDWRSVEAAAHAFAVREGAYRSLTNWTVDANGDLQGELTMPIKVGTVGGPQASNPTAVMALGISGAKSATELAELMGSVGLAQNFAALRALVTHGIQKGHMGLHARNLAATAGAPEQIFDDVVAGMIESGDVKSWKARELINKLQEGERRSEAEISAEGATGEAAGKVILLGEHAVVYDRHALALPLESSVTATIAENGNTGGITLSIPDWGTRQEWKPGKPVEGTAAEAVDLIMQKLGVFGQGFDILVNSRIPAAMGLGASAAFAVSVIRAFNNLLGKNMSNADIDNLAFECEGLTHGTPSGIDNNIATYGQPVLYSKSTRTRTRPFELIEVPPLVVAASGMRGCTKDQVAAVRGRYDRNTALYSTIFDEIDEISVAGSVALKNCDYEQLGSLMNVCHGLLNAIEVSTPEIEKMIAIARANGAVGAKLTGAGGGGSIVALCPGKSADVAKALGDAGYQIVCASKV